MSNMFEILDDIIFGQILTLLPVKSLVRFRCVCKLWNYFLSNPDQNFINSHVTRTSQIPEYESLIMYTRKTFNSSFSLYSLTSSRLSYTCIGKLPIHVSIHVCGSINGLVCVILWDRFMLWNPATGLGKTIMPPRHFLEDSIEISGVHFFGLGWNYAENDYKLVVCYGDKKSLKGAVYSCNSNLWTPLVVPRIFDLYPSSMDIIVKGCPYWRIHRNTRLFALKFQAETNQFREFELPDRNSGYFEFDLVNLRNRLVGMKYSTYGMIIDVHHLDERNGFWIKIYDFGPTICDVPLSICLCFKYNGEIVFDNGRRLYDPKTNEIKIIGNHDWACFGGFSYTASLVFLDGMEPVHTLSPWRVP